MDAHAVVDGAHMRGAHENILGLFLTKAERPGQLAPDMRLSGEVYLGRVANVLITSNSRYIGVV